MICMNKNRFPKIMVCSKAGGQRLCATNRTTRGILLISKELQITLNLEKLIECSEINLTSH